MYEDDTTIFTKPTKEDVTASVEILTRFRVVSGLRTKFEKSSITLIRCEGIDLNDVLGDLPAARSQFPVTYLGLSLTTTRPKIVHF